MRRVFDFKSLGLAKMGVLHLKVTDQTNLRESTKTPKVANTP
jgi:hypothetical protein